MAETALITLARDPRRDTYMIRRQFHAVCVPEGWKEVHEVQLDMKPGKRATCFECKKAIRGGERSV